MEWGQGRNSYSSRKQLPGKEDLKQEGEQGHRNNSSVESFQERKLLQESGAKMEQELQQN